MEIIEKELLPTEKFYNDIVLYHDKVDKILKLIRDYFDKRKVKCEKSFIAIEIIKGTVRHSTFELSDDDVERIEVWFRSDKSEKKEINNSIYILEIENKIFFCKIFQFKEKNSVLAGYILEDKALVRTFISKFSEQKIKEKYERILSIM